MNFHLILFDFPAFRSFSVDLQSCMSSFHSHSTPSSFPQFATRTRNSLINFLLSSFNQRRCELRWIEIYVNHSSMSRAMCLKVIYESFTAEVRENSFDRRKFPCKSKNQFYAADIVRNKKKLWKALNELHVNRVLSARLSLYPHRFLKRFFKGFISFFFRPSDFIVVDNFLYLFTRKSSRR